MHIHPVAANMWHVFAGILENWLDDRSICSLLESCKSTRPLKRRCALRKIQTLRVARRRDIFNTWIDNCVKYAESMYGHPCVVYGLNYVDGMHYCGCYYMKPPVHALLVDVDGDEEWNSELVLQFGCWHCGWALNPHLYRREPVICRLNRWSLAKYTRYKGSRYDIYKHFNYDYEVIWAYMEWIWLY